MSNLYREPIRHTCPDIDKLLSILNQSEKDYRDFKSEDESANDVISELIHVLGDVYDRLEDIRKSNSILRDWGLDLVSHSENLDINVSNLERELSILEDSIEELKQ